MPSFEKLRKSKSCNFKEPDITISWKRFLYQIIPRDEIGIETVEARIDYYHKVFTNIVEKNGT